MPKNKKEDSDEEEYEKEELSSLEKRRLRVIKREENIKKRKLNDQTNVKRKKLKFIESSEEEFDYSQETESDSECSTIPSDEEDVKEMIFYLPPGEYDLDDFEDNGYDIMVENLKKKDKDAYENFLKVKKNIEDKNPNIIDILKLPIHMKDKSKLVELYEVFKETQEPTLEWIQLRDLIVKLQKKYIEEFEEYNRYPKEEHVRIEQEAKKLHFTNTKTSLKRAILTLNTSDKNKSIIYKKYLEWASTESDHHDYHKMKSWLYSATQLPYDNIKPLPCQKIQFSKFLKKVLKKLNKELYGMDRIKEQIMIFLNTKLNNPKMKGCSLGLVGPPGVGKTTIAKCLAKCLDWPFQQISFGGVKDPSFLKGHDYTYVGSKPGEIALCMQKMKYKNGILFFDEYEKIGNNKDINSFLLHITDFQQNNEYHDSYFTEIDIDLSKLWFIYSMNSLPADSALRDRVYSIEVPGYKMKEKKKILCEYTLPKMLKNIGLINKEMTISEETAEHFIKKIDTGEPGIRNIENRTKELINKIHFMVKHQNKKGKLKGFDCMSFNCSSKLTYPLEINKQIIDELFDISEKDDTFNPLSMMYL
jgi:ATP-dependent Lon protease